MTRCPGLHRRGRPASPRLASCSPPSRTLRAACGGVLRPSLTAAARDALIASGRGGKTPLQPNRKTLLEDACRRTTHALHNQDIFTRYRHVPGANFAEIIERCQAYKAEALVDVICPNGLRTWEEIQEAIRLIPRPVVPLIPAHLSPYPSLQAQQDAGAAAAWFPALTTMAGLQANWDFLSDFRQRGTLALDALRAHATQSPWGVASNGRILDESHLRSMEEMYLPD